MGPQGNIKFQYDVPRYCYCLELYSSKFSKLVLSRSTNFYMRQSYAEPVPLQILIKSKSLLFFFCTTYVMNIIKHIEIKHCSPNFFIYNWSVRNNMTTNKVLISAMITHIIIKFESIIIMFFFKLIIWKFQTLLVYFITMLNILKM